MKPSRCDDAVVDLLDVILRDGVVVEADVIVTVADIPLVGIKVRAAVAGMATMSQYGLLQERNGEPSAATESSAATEEHERPQQGSEGIPSDGSPR